MSNSIDYLPGDWKLVKLREVCEKVETVKRKEKNPDEEFLYLDIGGVDNSANKIIAHKKYNWKDAPSRAQQIVYRDDILFSTVRTYMRNIAVVESKIYDAQIASSGFCILRSDKGVANPKFVFYYVLSEKFIRPLNELQTGSSYPAVRDKDVFIQPFPLPPKHTQHAIVSKIEELFSELDKGIESLRLAQQQLKTYRQSVLKWAFEGKLTRGLNYDSFDLNDANDLATKNQKNHNNHKNHSSDTGELPEGWKQVQIKEVAETYGGYAFKSGAFKSEGKYQVIRMGNVRPGILRYNESPVFLDTVEKTILSRSLLQINDIIITQTGTRKKRDYGFTALILKSNLLINQRIASIRFKDRYLPKFFLYFSWTDFFKDQFFANETGNVGQGNVGMKAVTETLIPFCSIEEQNIIVNEIENRLSVADKMEESISQSLEQAEALRQSILKKAFEGRLVEN